MRWGLDGGVEVVLFSLSLEWRREENLNFFLSVEVGADILREW